MKKRMLSLLLLLALLVSVLPVQAAAEETAEVQVTGRYLQTEARAMLDMVNELRTGSNAWAWNQSDTKKVYYSELEPLVYDYGLEKVAMQRAAEIALSFSHTRPSNERWVNAYTECLPGVYFGTKGENLAGGTYASYAGAAAPFDALCEEAESYSGQGHRRNMLDSDYTRIGIAGFYLNGAYYWVQELASDDSGFAETAANDGETVVSVTVAKSLVKSLTLQCSCTELQLTQGVSLALPAVTAGLTLSGKFPKGKADTVTVSPVWSLSGNGTAVLASEGITAKKCGQDTLTASVLGKTLAVPVTVTEAVSLLGDLNGDGAAGAADLTVLSRHLAGIAVIENEILLVNADLDGSESVDAVDLTLLAEEIS